MQIPALSEKQWKVAVSLLALLILIGAVLFTVDKCSDGRFRSKQDKLKTNVNTALANIAERNAVIANLKEQQAAEIESVKRDTQEYLESQSTSDAAKAETDKAIETMKQAANGNGNVSVSELQEKLKGL